MKIAAGPVVALVIACCVPGVFFAGCESPGNNGNDEIPEDTQLMVHYTGKPVEGDAARVADETGNGYEATLKGGARLGQWGDFGVIETGNGYVDLGDKTGIGGLIAALGDFTIAAYVYVDPSTDLNANGNFIWCFANSANMLGDQNGNMFLGARRMRYAISPARYESEQYVQQGGPLEKGVWKHVMYRQEGTNGTLYIDGLSAADGTVTMLPYALGSTGYNFIGRACYSGDKLLTNAMLYDFRIYAMAISGREMARLAVTDTLNILNAPVFGEQIDAYIAQIDLGDPGAVTGDIMLPAGAGGITVTWSADKPAYLSASGAVTRPAYGAGDQTVQLTGTFTRGAVVKTRVYTVVIKPWEKTDADSVAADTAALELFIVPNYYRPDSDNRIVHLPQRGAEGSAISWTSNTPAYSTDGGRIPLPAGAAVTGLVVTATIAKNGVSNTRSFSDFTALSEDRAFAGYLFAYFRGNTAAGQQLCFALSDDAKHWKALNNNEPVFTMPAPPATVTGMIRDPFILRGEDGWFYMTCTDMDAAKGWDSNYAIVLSKSPDLINWTHSSVNIRAKYPRFANIRAAWAPQVFWDNTAGKYMVYFSTAAQIGDYANDIIYYAYANGDFTDLEDAVTQLLYVSDGERATNENYSAAIDGDIVYRNGAYYLFYKTEGWRRSGSAADYDHSIVKAESERLTGPYFGYNNANKSRAVPLDCKNTGSYSDNVEGSSTFRLIGTDNWILMYDEYLDDTRYGFTLSTDGMRSFSDITSQITRDFNPRHGAVIPVTGPEKAALLAKWGN